MSSFVIDCGTCSQRDTPTCQDCVVSFVLDREPDHAVVFDLEEWKALRELQRAGMVPELRHDQGAQPG